MRTTWAYALLGLALLLGAAGTPAADTASQQAVAALEQTWMKAQQTNNNDLLEPLLADNVVQTSAEGKVTTTKAAALAEAKLIKWSAVDYSDVKVMVFGDAAVAIGNFRGKGTDTEGKAVDEHARFTDTWVKMPNGKWQCVASQDSPVVKKK